jgi:hypothetical protein
MKFLITALVIVQNLFLGNAYAREPMDLSLEIRTPKQGADAKQDAFDQATEAATRRVTEDLLGPEKTGQQWEKIKARVLKSSTRYVLFIKGSQPVPDGDQSKITVQMRLAPDVLETVLREMGEFAGNGVRVLPLIQISESRGSRYFWWADASDEKTRSLAQEYFKKVFQQLNAQFKGKSIYVLDPTNASFRMGVPPAYRTPALRREDQALFGQYMKADVVLSGKIEVVRTRSDSPEQHINYDLQLWQARNGRAVSDLTRSETATSDNPKVIGTILDQTDKKVFGEMAGKLAEAVGSGNLNLNVVRVTVVGPLSYLQQADFRRALGDLREVRVLKERLFEPMRVTYEIETSASGADLAKAITHARFTGFNVNVEGSQDNSLVLGVRATSAQ